MLLSQALIAFSYVGQLSCKVNKQVGGDAPNFVCAFFHSNAYSLFINLPSSE